MLARPAFPSASASRRSTASSPAPATAWRRCTTSMVTTWSRGIFSVACLGLRGLVMNSMKPAMTHEFGASPISKGDTTCKCNAKRKIIAMTASMPSSIQTKHFCHTHGINLTKFTRWSTHLDLTTHHTLLLSDINSTEMLSRKHTSRLELKIIRRLICQHQ